MKKFISSFGLVVVLFILSAHLNVPVSAWGYISTLVYGTNPNIVNEKGNVGVEVQDVDTKPIQGIEIRVIPPISDGIKVKNITVTLNGQVVCEEKKTESLICNVGAIQPGDRVRAQMDFQGKLPGIYGTYFIVVHDGIFGYHFPQSSVVPKSK